MAWILRAPGEQDDAIRALESMGVYGAVKKPDRSLRLYERMAKRIDPTTGVEIKFKPADQMTDAIRKTLNEKCWIVAHSSAFRHVGIFRG